MDLLFKIENTRLLANIIDTCPEVYLEFHIYQAQIGSLKECQIVDEDLNMIYSWDKSAWHE